MIRVRERRAERAVWEIEEYERVNRGWPPPEPRPARLSASGGDDAVVSIVVSLSLLLIYGLTGPFTRELPVCDRGCADSARILTGEWWRTITALTLHVDVTHVSGNALCCIFFGGALSGQVGSGLGWLLVLTAGGLGNAAAAVLGEPGHTAVGASTATFGALGALAALQFVRKWRLHGNLGSIWAPSWVAAGAGVALLALLGTGPRADLLGHFYGFVVGAALGTLPALWPVGQMSRPMQRVLLAVSTAIVLGAWALALQ